MTKSRFPKAVAEDTLVKSGRRCCLCHEFKGGKVEVHHIVPKADGGNATAANAIVLCFDCHAEVHAYWKATPKGRRFSAAELRRHRDQWFDKFSQGKVDAETDARITQVENQLQELKAEFAQTQQGVADIGTDELAKAAGPDTPRLLAEALQLQAEHKEREAIDALYAAFGRELEPLAKAQLHNLLGISFFNLSKYKEAEGHYRQALDASRQASHRQGEAAVLGNLGSVCIARGDLDGAEKYYKQSSSIERKIGNRLGEAQDLISLGIIHKNRGDLDRAEEHYMKALEIDREIGDKLAEAAALCNLGVVCRNRGDLDRAEEHYMKALEISREIGDKLGEAAALGNLGVVHKNRGDLDRAEEHHRQALAIHGQIGNKFGEADNLGNLGILAALRNKGEEACRLLKEAEHIYQEIGAGGPGPDTVRAALEKLGCE